MSLVAYGSSDESSEDEEVMSEKTQTQTVIAKEPVKTETNGVEKEVLPKLSSHLNLPVPRHQQDLTASDESSEGVKSKLLFDALPKPISAQYTNDNIEEDNDIPLFKPKEVVIEKPTKTDRAPVRISIPSLADFKDVDEELQHSKSKRTASAKGTGLFAILPPPKSELTSKKNNFIPHVLTKPPSDPAPKKSAPVTRAPEKVPAKPAVQKASIKETKNPLAGLDYDSNSDEDEGDGKHDFFSLTKPDRLPEPPVSVETNFFSVPEPDEYKNTKGIERNVDEAANNSSSMEYSLSETELSNNSGTTLVSTVMNMPRDEILLKNKAEVGPKLPVPEQEFNVDSEGNVAFDDKAIEYLCGKRGIKRKEQMIDEANIIEINGEDIKPDEREWMVKALTEEPVQRPVSMQGAGPSSQSKKKHQITYLAHQAKAMEIELKNTWSQNRMARKQTQSKYGF